MRAVLMATSETTGVTVEALIGEGRPRDVVRVRQAAQWLCCHRVGASRARCGDVFRRDHTTIMHALDQVDARLSEEGPHGPTQALLDRIWTEAKRYSRRPKSQAPRVLMPIILDDRPPSLNAVASMEHGSRAWCAANDQRWRYALRKLSQGGEAPQ